MNQGTPDLPQMPHDHHESSNESWSKKRLKLAETLKQTQTFPLEALKILCDCIVLWKYCVWRAVWKLWCTQTSCRLQSCLLDCFASLSLCVWTMVSLKYSKSPMPEVDSSGSSNFITIINKEYIFISIFIIKNSSIYALIYVLYSYIQYSF